MTIAARSALVSFALGLLAACGSSSSSPPSIPAAPTNVVAVAGDGQATVSWTASSGATSYNVYHSTSASVSKATGTRVAGAVSGGAVTGLTNGTASYFVATAVSAGGESAESSPVATATPTAPSPDFDGDWVVCRNDGGTDYRESFAITGTTVSFDTIDYGTTDTTCDGDGTAGTHLPLTAAFGAQVSAGLGSGSVLATAVDVTIATIPPETFYTLIYRDAAASPDALHLGDDTAPLDGSTPALRPVSLQSMARALQTTPARYDLTGTWRYCPVAHGEILILNAATGSFDLSKYTGTCGVGTPVERVTGTYSFVIPVYASLGGTTVTAFAVNLALTSPAAANVYQTVWVDTEASPRRLYHGDDTIHGMDGSAASLRPRVLWPDIYLKQ